MQFIPFGARCRVTSGYPCGIVTVAGGPGEKMISLIMTRQNDGRQEVAPDLTGLHEATKQSVEPRYRRLSVGRLAVSQSQRREVGGLGAPQWAGQSAGSQRSGHQKRPGPVKVSGNVRQMEDVRSDDGPLGGQSPDDGRGLIR